MPRRRRYVTYPGGATGNAKRRKYKKKGYYVGARRGRPAMTNNAASVRLLSVIGGFPNSLTTKLRYVDYVNLDASTVISDSVVYRANSVHDPQFSIGGHAPYLYDTYTTLYKQFVVVGSRITVEPLFIGVNSVIPGTFGVTLSSDSTLPYTDNNTFMESRGRSTASYQYGQIQALSSTVRPRCSKNFSTRKFFGIKDPADGKTYEGTSGVSNPATQAYFHIWAINNAGNDPAPMNFRLTIDYIVQFKDPKILAGS